MNFHSWFVYVAVQLTSKISFRTRRNFLAQQLKEENERIKGIQKKSAQEIEYISKFTYWPLAQAKNDKCAPKNSVIPLKSPTQPEIKPYSLNDKPETIPLNQTKQKVSQ
ncbi:hypothetical protein [Colwellia sp. RSH04]|uniref:hypothetical protein n=1 Tax=Colwellia sp. RSH04 TaxID=2305464 RepID=UPI000E56BA3E|nr:hypothetical protein [Colwellia sp. RSH04]RHW74960.1 hypothetical protein D1094_16170 [Colwellia sp. RSH04]